MTEQELKDKEYRLVHDEYTYGDVEELIAEIRRLQKRDLVLHQDAEEGKG